MLPYTASSCGRAETPRASEPIAAGHTAWLSNEGACTVFSYGDETLRFAAPYSLERYVRVTEWDAGYLSVLTKYQHSADLIEEYIDLLPILENLYMDADAFLTPIKVVEVIHG